MSKEGKILEDNIINDNYSRIMELLIKKLKDKSFVESMIDGAFSDYVDEHDTFDKILKEILSEPKTQKALKDAMRTNILKTLDEKVKDFVETIY
ncbi:MAG: hypothetical protein WC523_04655 [Patescibacteria group bacterium]